MQPDKLQSRNDPGGRPEEDLRSLVPEDGWPCHRLRLANGLILFFLFEELIGKQLPQIMPLLMLGLGLTLFGSAWMSIQKWQQTARIALIQEAIDRARG